MSRLVIGSPRRIIAHREPDRSGDLQAPSAQDSSGNKPLCRGLQPFLVSSGSSGTGALVRSRIPNFSLSRGAGR